MLSQEAVPCMREGAHELHHDPQVVFGQEGLAAGGGGGAMLSQEHMGEGLPIATALHTRLACLVPYRKW